VRALLAITMLGVAGIASAATVTIDRPTQSETTSGTNVMVSVTVSDDFVIGQDGWVELWVDGNFATWLKESTGVVTLSPGNHTIQARLVTVYHQPLRIPAVSDRVLVTVPSADPSGGD
jgi:hypothetical protein